MIGRPGSGIIEVRIPELPPATLPLTGLEIIQLIQDGRSRKAFLNSVAAFGTNWQFINSNDTASAGVRYAADTSAGSFQLSLPGNPAQGDAIEVADPEGTWQANPLTVARNGSTIEGLSQDMTMDLNRARVVLAFDGTTWRVFGE